MNQPSRASAAETTWRRLNHDADKSLTALEVASLRSLRRYAGLVDRRANLNGDGTVRLPANWEPLDDSADDDELVA